MERTIITKRDVQVMPKAVATPIQKEDNYLSRLLKYIPAESVSAYMTLDGLVRSSQNQLSLQIGLWAVFGIGLIGTWFYLWKLYNVTKIGQLVISTIAFAIWVFALGGSFAYFSWYQPWIGKVLITVYTFLI